MMINRPQEDKKAELEIRNLRLSFGGVVAVKDVDMAVHTGELMAVIGPNGAGKTSLLDCITGFYRPQQGQILFNGRDITHLHTHQLVGIGIGRTFQNIELFPGMTVLANMTLARHIHCGYSFCPPASLRRPSAKKKSAIAGFSKKSSTFWRCNPFASKPSVLCRTE